MQLTKIHKILTRIVLTFLILNLFFATKTYANENQEFKSLLANSSDLSNIVEGEILVKFKKDKINLKANSAAAESFIDNKFNLKRKKDLKDTNISLYSTNGQDMRNLLSKLQNDENVEFAQPNYQYSRATINTNDTYRKNLWGLDNTGQTFSGINSAGTADADIDAPEAWSFYNGTKPGMIVAIIDSGVDYTHPDLKANMWDGTSCKDSAGNPLGGCKFGYDFWQGDKDPMPLVTDPYKDHGTHVAGIIGATNNNGIGVLGVAKNVKLMSLQSRLVSSEIIEAIAFAKYNGAKIINASWGGHDEDPATKDAIADFPGVFIAAAHNYSQNVDDGNPDHAMYPCSDNLENIICVAATDYNDKLSSFSNYGTKSVDIAAPGSYILSTVGWTGDPTTSYLYFNGTSMATPYVSGSIALIWSYQPNLSVASLRSLILNYADVKPSLNGKVIRSRRLNLNNSLRASAKLVSVYRFWSDSLAHHFYTASEVEKDAVIKNYPDVWKYEKIAYSAVKLDLGTNKCGDSSAQKVYRFWSEKKRTHFYTISEEEKGMVLQKVANKTPGWDWTLEQPNSTFCGYTTKQINTMPLYRFWSNEKQGHFYTSDEGEKISIINKVTAREPGWDWQYEGIAYYVYK